MGKIFKNMLPYWKWIIVIIAFLVVQANCDLALPQYTSDIIDVGIQNKGIKHILPEKITQEDYEKAQLLMTTDERKLFIDAYEEIEDSDEEASYKLVADKDELDELDDKLIVPIVMVYQMTSVDASEFTMSEDVGNQDVDMDVFMQLVLSGQLHDDAIKEMRKGVQDKIDAIDVSTLKSMGIAFAINCDENAGLDVESIQMKYLWRTGGLMLLYAFVMGLCAVVVGYCASKVGAGVGRDLREKTFFNVVGFSNAEINKFSTASLITRSTNDVQQVQMVTAVFLRMILYAPIIGIGGILKVAETKAGMEWVIGLAVILIIGFVMVLMSVAMPKFKIMQTLVDRLNLVSREILTGLSVIRAFGREQREEERFDEANRNLTRTQLFTNRVMTFMMPGMSMVMYGITLLIVWVSANRIDAGQMQVGQMTAFITYTMIIVMSFLMLTAMSIMMPRAGVAAARIEEVVKTDTSIKDAPNPVSKKHNGKIEFSHVNFRYPGAQEDVLSDIDFVAEPGKTTAIIGSTGCGKSTLVNLIPRFYDVTAGSIKLDGEDIRNYSLEELRNTVGFVPQKGILFSGTIASNLRFGARDASDEQIKKAATIAQAADFIEEKNDKYNSAIAQGGSNVSGGQKQRLAIARAIAKQPKLYVFDDSFSALDMKTDATLRKALEEVTADSTVLIVAQRISTILHADQIIVLDDGIIVGKGTHEELLRNCETYEQIARSQMSAKELGLPEEESQKSGDDAVKKEEKNLETENIKTNVVDGKEEK